jgi:hypothetical protein
MTDNSRFTALNLAELISRPNQPRDIAIPVLWLVCSLSAAPVTHIFVEPFGNKPGAAQVRAEVVALLEKQTGVSIVNAPPTPI